MATRQEVEAARAVLVHAHVAHIEADLPRLESMPDDGSRFLLREGWRHVQWCRDAIEVGMPAVDVMAFANGWGSWLETQANAKNYSAEWRPPATEPPDGDASSPT